MYEMNWVIPFWDTLGSWSRTCRIIRSMSSCWSNDEDSSDASAPFRSKKPTMGR